MGQTDESRRGHRANYVLEQGTWRATCQVCGYYVTDPMRRRAASLFRTHIRGAKEAAEVLVTDDPGVTGAVIDLRGATDDTPQIRM